MNATKVPALRVRGLNTAAVRAGGEYVLYWMIASRRTGWNFCLDRAVEWCRELNRPLLVFEPLRCGYPFASDRLHTFVLQGMADNRDACERAGIAYCAYVEPAPGDGKGLLAALARQACVVVTDDHPGFFYPAMLRAAATQVAVKLEAVDGNGLLPLADTDRPFHRAYDLRRHLQKTLRQHLGAFPVPAPLEDAPPLAGASVPAAVTRRWPPASEALLQGDPGALAALEIDHRVPPVDLRGGAVAAEETLERFVEHGLPHYAEQRNQPELEVSSGLSPYLHFGHIAAHHVFRRIMAEEVWAEDLLAAKANGAREGWWGTGVNAEAFLDQLITWRELGYRHARRDPAYARYESLPAWALETLEVHASDPREQVYAVAEFESAATHDPLWNAAQRQLMREGRIHNYLRMLWGKKILEWSASPREALRTMLTLNDKYALDGRDPNSVSGITWCLGRYDRAWGPERPVFGKVRYMSSKNTARKVSVKGYLQRYGPNG